MLGTLIFWESVRVGRLRYHWPMRVGVALLHFGVFGLAYLSLLSFAGDFSPGRLRQILGFRFFQWFSIVILILTNAAAFAFTLVAFAEERDRRTLETLQGVGVRAWQIVAGKLVLVQFRLWEAVVAATPVGVLAVLLGGVSGADVVQALTICLAIAFATSAFVGLVSATFPLLVATVVSGVVLLSWFLIVIVMNFMGAWAIVRSPWMRVHPLVAVQATYPDLSFVIVPVAFSVGIGLLFAGITSLLLFRAARRHELKLAKPRAAETVGLDPLAWERARIQRLAFRKALPWLVACASLAAWWTASQSELYAPSLYSGLQSGVEPGSVRLLAVLSAMWCGFAVVPAAAMFAAAAASLDRRRGSLDLMLLAEVSRREQCRSQAAFLARIGVFALAPIVVAGVCCYALHWTTAFGIALAVAVAASAMTLSGVVGLWIGWTSGRPLTASAYVTVLLVVWAGICHLLYDNAPRNHSTYEAITMISPGHHLGVLLAVDCGERPKWVLNLSDGPLTGAETRPWALLVLVVYASIAAALYLALLRRLTALDGPSRAASAHIDSVAKRAPQTAALVSAR